MRDVKTIPVKGRGDFKRLSVNIPMPIFKGIMRATEIRYCTVTKWITRAIVEKLQREEELLLPERKNKFTD